ncbi:MAG TPA: glycine oxidase ThiO [Vicinamibacterales bacterium]|nr:glycine oxidase ThiO [Vicinamibacterales bacterium]
MDAVIVGAGIIGCAIAHELTMRGVACTVLDDRPVGGGATQASAGMLAPYVEAHDPGPLLDLGVRSLALYDDWIDRIRRASGIDVEYRRIGTLEIALDPQHATELRTAASVAPNPPRTWMEPAAVRPRQPSLGALDGALFTPTHGYVAAHQLAHALARAAETRGARFHAARARRITRTPDGFIIHTTTGEVTAKRVVLAAGSWSSAIEIDGAAAVPVRPVRGQLLHLGWHEAPLDTIIWGPECYVVPRLDGTVLVGATVEDVGFDERATSAGVRDLLDAFCELLPGGWGAAFLEARVGLRPAAPDDLPIIGRDANVDGLVHATAHYRNGVLLAPITAVMVADLITAAEEDPALQALAPGRFR